MPEKARTIGADVVSGDGIGDDIPADSNHDCQVHLMRGALPDNQEIPQRDATPALFSYKMPENTAGSI